MAFLSVGSHSLCLPPSWALCCRGLALDGTRLPQLLTLTPLQLVAELHGLWVCVKECLGIMERVCFSETQRT